MKLSVGLVLHDFCKVLVCHSTNNGFWDFPKGEQENDEAYIFTCMREVKEETGFDLSGYLCKIKDIGEYQYIPGRKKLRLFSLFLNNLPDITSFKCSSKFVLKGREYPEVDGYEYIDAKKYDQYLSSKMCGVFEVAWRTILDKKDTTW
jgi:8-oxo-dGTP pyrophosphatase MutT (NUDIX family)